MNLFFERPSEMTMNDPVAKPYIQDKNVKVIDGKGDGSVPSDSALIPVLKWAYEFDKK